MHVTSLHCIFCIHSVVGTTEIGRAAARREGRIIHEVKRPDDLVLERGDNFYDPRMSMGAWRGSPNENVIEKFYLILAVCHTVMAKPREGALLPGCVSRLYLFRKWRLHI